MFKHLSMIKLLVIHIALLTTACGSEDIAPLEDEKDWYEGTPVAVLGEDGEPPLGQFEFSKINCQGIRTMSLDDDLVNSYEGSQVFIDEEEHHVARIHPGYQYRYMSIWHRRFGCINSPNKNGAVTVGTELERI